MKKLFLLTILLHLTFIVKAQTSLSLDSCRALALTNNKDLLISHEKINAAHYQRKAAFTNYLPNFSATGAYMRNQKEFSLLNNDQKAALSGLGSNLAGPIGQAAAGIIATYPELAPLISSLSGSLPAALDQAGNSFSASRTEKYAPTSRMPACFTQVFSISRTAICPAASKASRPPPTT